MKFFGCLLILLSSVICAFFYEKSLILTQKKYAEIIEFIKFAKNQIEYFSTSIDKIFTSFESKYINDILESRNAITLSSDDSELLNEYFSSLGKGYKKQQLDMSEYYLNHFQEKYTKLNLQMPNKIKIFRAMSLFCGATVLIFLV